jgi:hypothetical protein
LKAQMTCHFTNKTAHFDEMELSKKSSMNQWLPQVALLNRITYYIVNRKGKCVHVCFLNFKMVSSGIKWANLSRCVRIELIHTATLVHELMIVTVAEVFSLSMHFGIKLPFGRWLFIV